MGKKVDFKSFTIGFALCLILMSSGVYAITQYYLRMPITIEKKPPDYVADIIDVLVNGAEMQKNIEIQGSGITLPIFAGNVTTVTKVIFISNMEDITHTIAWSVTGVPEGANVTITRAHGIYDDPSVRKIWKAGEPITLPPRVDGASFSAWITVTDVGLEAGTYQFMLTFYTV
jgi:hypothetical protein